MRYKKIAALALSIASIFVMMPACSNNSGTGGKPGDEPSYSAIEETQPFYDQLITENYNTNIEESEQQSTFSSSASWIWDSSTSATLKNVWVRFRKTFSLAEKPAKAVAKIAAESRYFMWVNEEMVVYDGSLKRGVDTHDGYYDLVDLTEYLTEGENTICILAWYWGAKGESYSNYSTGKAGLIFEADVDGNLIVSDGTWATSRDCAYTNDKSDEDQPNYRLPEYNVSYDASLESDTDWIKKSFSDEGWNKASVNGSYGSAPWYNLWKRPIPMNKDYGVQSYTNSSDYEGMTTIRRTAITLKVGTNVQLSPVFTINATKAGQKVIIYTESTQDSQGDSLRCYYYTKEGENTFECLSYMNGQFVYYDFPTGVTINYLGYRQTGYDTEKSGGFECDDDFYNRLWQMSYDTLYVTMRDNFMDCPNRERAQWMGDVTNEMEQIIYSMDENSYLLYEKSLRQMIGFTGSNNVLPTVAPISRKWFELPIQNLCTISGAWTYYLYSGRSAIIEEVFPYFYNYLNLWDIGDDGLVVHREGSWDWMDNDAINAHTEAIENAWYYKALSALSNMAQLVGDEEGKTFTQTRMELIYESFNANVLDEMISIGDDRANSIAVLSGLVKTEDYPRVAQVLKQKMYSSPFWEKYVLEALCEMGYTDLALARMQARYSDMVNFKMHGESYSTLWEKWNTTGGTKNHAWSGGPMTVLSKYILGVKPLTSNYDSFIVKPSAGSLNEVNGTVPTLKGNITVSYKDSAAGFTMSVNSPEGSQCVLAVPFDLNDKLVINGKTVCEGGYMKDDAYTYAGIDDGYIYFLVSGGEYSVSVT